MVLTRVKYEAAPARFGQARIVRQHCMIRDRLFNAVLALRPSVSKTPCALSAPG
jgi:hypothetical protein